VSQAATRKIDRSNDGKLISINFRAKFLDDARSRLDSRGGYRGWSRYWRSGGLDRKRRLWRSFEPKSWKCPAIALKGVMLARPTMVIAAP
jgi:hypothetical protein